MQPTVADANLLLGRMDEATFLGGGIHLDRERGDEDAARADGLVGYSGGSLRRRFFA
jgi:N-methylhydantoinase A/oxoprolinase/acetone carboxylase beta subunit